MIERVLNLATLSSAGLAHKTTLENIEIEISKENSRIICFVANMIARIGEGICSTTISMSVVNVDGRLPLTEDTS